MILFMCCSSSVLDFDDSKSIKNDLVNFLFAIPLKIHLYNAVKRLIKSIFKSGLVATNTKMDVEAQQRHPVANIQKRNSLTQIKILLFKYCCGAALIFNTLLRHILFCFDLGRQNAIS